MFRKSLINLFMVGTWSTLRIASTFSWYTVQMKGIWDGSGCNGLRSTFAELYPKMKD